MKLLKKRGVAVIITVVVILLMALWGIRKAPVELPPVQTGQWVYDGADVFSPEEEQYLTQGNAGLLSDHGAVVAIAAVPDAKGWNLWDFCMDLADKWGLNGSDMILVLDIGGDNYWLVQGYDLVDSFSDDQARQYTRQFLENDFAAKNYGAGAIKLFDALRSWYGASAEPLPQYADSAPVSFADGGPVRSGGVGFGGIVLLIVFIIILLISLDAMRYSRYRRRWYGVTPTVVYRPLIFGRPRRPRRPPPPPRGPRPPSGGGFGGSRPGGTTRPPSGGPRPGGATRPPSGGSFGSGRSGGGFSGGRTGSSGGGRSGSSFGGGRTGSFGGGRSGGSFGGGRSGSFGGGRSGGSFGGGRGGGRR